MDEVRGLVVKPTENPVTIEDDAQKRRTIAVVGLTAAGGVGERLAESLKVIAE